MSLHCMIDLETMDTRPSAVVLSIGAVLFDPTTESMGPAYYAKLQVGDQIERGRTQSSATLEWWARQPDAAREEAFGDAGKLPVEEALAGFRQFLDSANDGGGVSGVWGNGAAFDNVILASLYHSYGEAPAWPFWMDRCFRTLVALFDPSKALRPQFAGTAHNALDDAFHQARYLQALVRADPIARF